MPQLFNIPIVELLNISRQLPVIVLEEVHISSGWEWFKKAC